MNFKTSFIFAVAFWAFVPVTLLSQNWDDDDDFYVPRRQGLEYGINLGVYQANQNSSAFYNGAGWYELGDNQASLYTIEDRLYLGNTEDQINNLLNLGGGNFWIPYDSSPLLMPYDPGLMMGLKLLYFWNPESALVMSIDAVNLNAAGSLDSETDMCREVGRGVMIFVSMVFSAKSEG